MKHDREVFVRANSPRLSKMIAQDKRLPNVERIRKERRQRSSVKFATGHRTWAPKEANLLLPTDSRGAVISINYTVGNFELSLSKLLRGRPEPTMNGSHEKKCGASTTVRAEQFPSVREDSWCNAFSKGFVRSRIAFAECCRVCAYEKYVECYAVVNSIQ